MHKDVPFRARTSGGRCVLALGGDATRIELERFQRPLLAECVSIRCVQRFGNTLLTNASRAAGPSFAVLECLCRFQDWTNPRKPEKALSCWRCVQAEGHRNAVSPKACAGKKDEPKSGTARDMEMEGPSGTDAGSQPVPDAGHGARMLVVAAAIPTMAATEAFVRHSRYGRPSRLRDAP